MPTQTTVALGYDPGGNGRHGVAVVRTDETGAASAEVVTEATAERAYERLASWLPSDTSAKIAIGIDTLTTWSTGSAGWRPADEWLRAKYPDVQNSVASPNSLYGAMALSGISVLLRLRELRPSLIASETHPKVLYRALARQKYAFALGATSTMNVALRGWLGVDAIELEDDHQWDALASAWAVREGLAGRWTHDLHTLPARAGETLIRPAGTTQFWWPER